MRSLKFLFFLLTLIQAPTAFAGNIGGITETQGAQILSGTTGIHSLNTSNWSDINYYTFGVQSTQVNKKIQNVITFKINEETSHLITADFTATAHIQVEFGAGPSSVTTLTYTLEVDYKIGEGIKYNPKQYLHFEGAQYVKVTLTSISAPTVGSLNTKDILSLTNEMIITRYFELPSTVPAPHTFGYTVPPVDIIPDHLNVYFSWYADIGSGISTGNNATQLEWVWIESEAQDNYKTGGVFDNELIFKNATRVDLDYDQTAYDIPMLYDGNGYLFYRIRAVNIKEQGGRSDGPWNVAAPYAFAGHNENLNWQATTTFAENGKRKTVVQYFDGSLRNRQTVTKDNSTNSVITAETFYDGQGRPAIQILPAPGIGDLIKYQQNLNLFNGQTVNHDPSEIFDIQPVATPNSLTPELVTTTGTSKYYSPNNDELSSGTNKTIPDAEGYPYTYTRYTPDGTGRIMAQSGVGPAHKMGTGHETKYYYGTAAQEELDGLFGTEVGNFTHYSKNMVKDANGQMSISYVDMHGRTIATALAGESPANLDALDITNPDHYPNQAGTEITRNLLDNTTNQVKSNSIESVNSLLVPVPMTYHFKYELNPQVLEMAACEGAEQATLCYDCLYDLEISVTDESGETNPIVKKFSNVSLTPADDNCSTATPQFKELPSGAVTNTILFDIPLSTGSYSIRKTLSISESSFQHYKELYMSKALCKTEQEIIDSVYNVLQTTSGCGTATPVTCASCLAALGTVDDFRTAYLTSLGLTMPFASAPIEVQHDITTAYDQALQNCNRLCNTASQALPSIREMMLADMKPYNGQYAVADYLTNSNTDGAGSHTMFEKYNIFSAATPSVQPFYKHPQNTAGASDFYYNDLGNIDQTIHPGTTPNLTFLNSTTVPDFVSLFNENWTNALLPHHPEYVRLKYAEDNLASSFNFINSMMNIETCPSSGSIYLDPSTNDPFFIGHPSLSTDLHLDNYQGMGISIYKLAYGSARCSNITDFTLRQSCYTSLTVTTPPPYAGFTAEENDVAWNTFKGLYAAVRNDIVNNFIADAAPLPAGDEAALVNQHYRLWFPRNNAQSALQNGWSWWPSSAGAGPNLPLPLTLIGSPLVQYTSQCDSYISRWKTQLLQCAALAARSDKEEILTAITTRMKAVCVLGSNAANPYGSSNVAPATASSVTERSFEDVIRNVFTEKGLLTSGGAYTDNYCNPFVIDWPKPYGKGPKLVQQVTSQVDSCNCSQYAIVKADAIAHSVNVNNLSAFNAYLLTAHGDTLTPAMYTALQEHCGAASQECVCYELQDIQELFFDTNFNGGIEPCPLAQDSLTISSRTGNQPANYVAGHSITFMPGFESGTNDSFSATINSVDSTCDPVVYCHDKFTVFFNEHYQNGTGNLSFAQISALYLSTCGIALDVCHGKGETLEDLPSEVIIMESSSTAAADEACSATVLTAGTSCNFTTYNFDNATPGSSLALPSCIFWPGTDADVWFKTTVPAGATSLIINTKWIPGSITDCVMAVYTATGTCPSLVLTEVACNDNGSNYLGMPKAVLAGVTPGTDYYIRMFSFNNDPGDFDICVYAPPAPANDNCSGADTLIPSSDKRCESYVGRSLEGSTPSGISAPSCYTGSGPLYDVWYKFIATGNRHKIRLNNWTGGYPSYTVAAYTGSCGSLTEIGCAPSGKVLDLQNLTTGNVYYIRVATSDLTVSGFTLCVSSFPRPANCSSHPPYHFIIPQPLPDFLKCGYEQNAHCISCAGLSTLTAQYKAAFTAAVNTAPVFTGTTLTPEQLQYNMNFARFINYRTGFQFNWIDYANAADKASCNLDNYASNSGATQNVICSDTHPLTQIPVTPPADPCEAVHTMAINIGQNIYQIRKEYLLQQFDAAYKAKCLAAKDIELFTVNYTTSEYHYTLYYYDLSGNLVKTVPPKGVNPDFSATFTNSVKAARAAGTNVTSPITRPHTFVTDYRYNSLNQVTAQNTPDANGSHFWYDALGRLVVSQNAKQAAEGTYSYTLYDDLGRIMEVGQKPQSVPMTQTISRDKIALNEWINTNGGTKEQITATVYDDPFEPLAGDPTYMTQQNLRNRVSYTYTKNLDSDTYPAAATYYTYDVHGNVDKLLQDYREITEYFADGAGRYKLMTYDYDLISGKVNMVSYQPGKPDAFYHKYGYDAENRITGVQTSRDKILWETDATYNYLKHGPLARTELGQLRVQGLDYAYTIHGWLKGVNSTSLAAGWDPAGDGSSHTTAAKDIYGFALHYYGDVNSPAGMSDYKPIGSTNPFATPDTHIDLRSLYNGNIAGMTVNLGGLLKGDSKSTNALPLFYRYSYDQLNRITAMQAHKGLDESTNEWSAIALDDYLEAVSYDPNGNILTYNRNGAPAAGMPTQMDQLTYNYNSSTNQLRQVGDDVSAGNYDDATVRDIDGQSESDNYTYDQIGNMTTDKAEHVLKIDWSVYGKISMIQKADPNVNIFYFYDPAGNRIGKKVDGKITHYVRDASGNVMSVYEATQHDEPVQKEVHLYGSSRLGMVTTLTVPPVTDAGSSELVTAPILSTFTRGEKIYELSNHLGNVLTTISDKKIGVDNNSDDLIDSYNADVVTANDYYPFGMQMPGRRYSSGSAYRYGFNGKEKSDEVYGEGNAYDFGGRIQDPRLGRWFSVDPKTQKYPNWSPYNYAINNPINVIDPDGEDIILLTWVTTKGDPGHTAIAVRDYKDISKIVKGKIRTFHVPLNTYTVYELGPRDPIPRDLRAFTNTFTPNYEPRYGVTYDEIMENRTHSGVSVSKYDGFHPEGVLRILTDGYKDDSKIKAQLTTKNEKGALYQTQENNCTSYCADVIPTYNDKKIDASETFDLGDKKVTMQTPIKLYLEVEKQVERKRINHIKLIPKNLIKDIKKAYETNPKRGETPKK